MQGPLNISQVLDTSKTSVMLLDTSNPFLWTGRELVILDDDHSNIHIFTSVRDATASNSSRQAPGHPELLSIEHVLSIPVYQYAQVSLVPTMEKDVESVSLLINESMLAVVDRCGGLLRLYTEETVGHAFAEIRCILRLAETRYVIFTATDAIELDLEENTSQDYIDGGSAQILHVPDDPALHVSGPVLNINLKYSYGPTHLYLLAMVSTDIYLLKIYELKTRRMVCQIYFYERVVSLQELPGAGSNAGKIVVADTGKIYIVRLRGDSFVCSNAILKGYNLTQNIEKLVVLPQYAAVETETRMQYLYSITWESDTLIFNNLLWSDDTSLAPLINQDGIGSTAQSKSKVGVNDILQLINSLYSTSSTAPLQSSFASESAVDMAMSPCAVSSEKRTLSTSSKVPFGTAGAGVLSSAPSMQSVRSRPLLKNLAVHVCNNTNALLFILDDGFILSPLPEPGDSGLGFIVREETEVIFSEVLSALIGYEMPLNAILNATVLKTSNYSFVFRFLNFSTGSSFEFPFTSTNLAKILQESDRTQPVFKSYGVFSVDDYIVTWLLAGNVCFGFYLSFKTRICLTTELQLEGDVYFSYPLVRPLYKADKTEESNIVAQHILTYYILETHISTDFDSDDLGTQAVASQRTLLSFFVSTRTHILTEFRDSSFQVTEVATITPVTVQYEMLLQGQTKLLRAMMVPYLMLSDSSFILITETNSETSFYLFVFDAHRGTAEVSLLEHDIALAFLCDHNESLGHFGYIKMETFHLSGLIDFYISGILRQKLKDKVTKTASQTAPLETQKPKDLSLSKVNTSVPVASMEFSDMLLKGTVQNFLVHRQLSRDPEVSVVGVSTLQHILADTPLDTYPILANGTLASMNDQIEKLVIDKQYNPYSSLSAAKKHKKVRKTLYFSVDNDIDASDEALSESSNTKSHVLSGYGSYFHEDGITSVVSLKKKLDLFKKNEGYAGEYAIQPMKAKVTRFLRLCISISSTTSKQSIDYRAELNNIDNILMELATSPRLDNTNGSNVSFGVSMTPEWIDTMISQFSLKCSTTGDFTEIPVSPHASHHNISDIIPQILQQECGTSTRLLSDGLHKELRDINEDSSDSEDSINSHVNDAPKSLPKSSTLSQMLDTMRDAAIRSEPSLLETIVEAYLPSNYFSLDSLGFLQIYNSTQRILATILITPLKRLYHNVFMVIAKKDGLITDELRDRLKLGRASMSTCQNLDFLASDLINCREIVNCVIRDRAIDHLYGHHLSFTLSCLSALVIAGVLYMFLQDADRRPFLSAVDAALSFVIEGYLRARPGMLPSIRLVFSLLVINSLFSKFAAVAFLRLLTARLTKLCIEGTVPKSTLDGLVFTTLGICELNFGLLMCKQLPLMHLLVIHREIFHKIVLTIEALAFMKNPTLSRQLGLGKDAVALLDAALETSASITCGFQNSLANSNFKRFSPGFGSYFLTNLAFLLHTFCTYASIVPTLIPAQHSIVLLKTVTLQELIDSPSAFISSCKGISSYYRGLHASSNNSINTHTQHIQKRSDDHHTHVHTHSQHRFHEHFFEDAQKILSESLTTLSVRSLYTFVTYIKRHEQKVWRCHSTRFIQLLIYLMQRLSMLERASEKQAGTDLLTTFPLEKSILNRQSLLASLRERLFDFSYSLSPIALVRLTTGNDISIIHGFTPGFLTIKFLESSTQALNLQKSLALEEAYNYFLKHKAERYKLTGMLPPFNRLNDPLLGISSDKYKTYGKILPCVSFISIDPQNEFTLVYCHNYNAIFIYRLSSNIDDVYLIGSCSTDLFDIIHPGSHTLLTAKVVWAEAKKSIRAYRYCEIHYTHRDPHQTAVDTVEMEECIWKTTRHEKPVKHLALFTVEDEQEEYGKKQQEERHTDLRESVPKPDKRQYYLVTQEKTSTKETTVIRLKIKKRMAH